MRTRLIGFGGAMAAALALSACSVSVGSTNLDVDKAESEIASGIQEQTGLTVTVSCPDDVPIQAGGTFGCDVTDSSGGNGTVIVTQRDDEGNITWELERGGTLPTGSQLDTTKVEEEITSGLAEQSNIDAVVTCPTNVAIEANTSFNCTATDNNGDSADVKVTMTDDKGNITWEVV
ncbi:MAG: DUF4333 domain-containing protein [Actinomycetia bacterium]|nr:DUF4333 domain-containing protein [Actinomycetes bacterium]